MGDCGVGPLHESGVSQATAYGTLVPKPSWTFSHFQIGCMVAFSVLTVLIMWIERKFSSSFDASAASFNTAGNAVGIGLGASVMVSQWTWAATLQQSTTVAFKYGVSGPFWYAAGATMQMFLFAILAVELKRKAPRSKTFLEIIRIRYGTIAHVVYTGFALTTNIMVTAMLLLGGAAALNAASGCNKMIVSVLMPLGYLLYTFIGGLRAKIISCYFNTVVIMFILLLFCFVVYYGTGQGVVYTWDPETNQSTYVGTRDYIGSFTNMYTLLGQREAVAKAHAANDSTCEKEFPFLSNQESSFLTMSSNGGLMFGVISIIGSFGTVFIDQSNWQNAIASRPDGTVKSFFLGALVWFCVPWTLASGLGLAAQALGGLGITLAEAETGIVPMIVSYQLLGEFGLILFMIQLVIAVLSTGAGELTAMASLITYDFFQNYYDPAASPEKLKRVSQISIIIFGILMGTFGVILDATGLSLGFVYQIMGILIGSAVVPVVLTLMWTNTTAGGVVTGGLVGLVSGFTTWMLVGHFHGGEISFVTLGSEIPLLAGNIVSLGVSGLIAIAWGFIAPAEYDFKLLRNAGTEPHEDDIPKSEESRLYPNPEIDFEEEDLSDLHDLQEGEDRAFLKKSCKLACGFGTTAGLILTVFWPIPMYLSGYHFGQTFFTGWVIVSLVWACLGSAVVIFLPIGESWREIYDITKNICSCRTNKSREEDYYDPYYLDNQQNANTDIDAQVMLETDSDD